MKCDGCTLCCKLIDVPWMNSPAGKYCDECIEGKGCAIFDRIPKDCKEYQCLYNQVDKCSENFRPDKCHVIFEKIGDDIVTGLIDEGFDMNEDVQKQISSFLREGLSVFMSKHGRGVPIVIPASNRTAKYVYDKVMAK